MEDITDPRDITALLAKIPLNPKFHLRPFQREGLEFMWKLLMPNVVSVDKSERVSYLA